MDLAFENTWHIFEKRLSAQFGDELDLQSILFLIGIQELGFGYRKYSKDEKLHVIHVAVCSLLEEYGYYSFEGRDADGWPHFKFDKTLPNLSDKDQERLIKEAVMNYFTAE